MDILKGLDLDDLGRPNDGPDLPMPRPLVVGSPLSTGAMGLAGAQDAPAETQRSTAAPVAGRALASGAQLAPPAAPPSGFQKAMNMLRVAVPIVQKILPLIDGQIATTVSNILAPHPPAHPAQQSPESLALKDGLTDLQMRHRELRERIAEQNTSLKRVEDRLEMVREATDRNTLEQQELIEDLKKLGSKGRLFALAGLGLLTISIILNVILLLLFQKRLP